MAISNYVGSLPFLLDSAFRVEHDVKYDWCTFRLIDRYRSAHVLESGVHGSVAMISNLETLASNPYISDTYDVLHLQLHYTWIEITHGTATSQPLPYAKFLWHKRDEIDI